MFYCTLSGLVTDESGCAVVLFTVESLSGLPVPGSGVPHAKLPTTAAMAIMLSIFFIK